MSRARCVDINVLTGNIPDHVAVVALVLLLEVAVPSIH